MTDYTAIVMTPHLYSTAFPYQVLWLGVYRNALAMGAGEALWLADGGELEADFAKVVSCSIHAQYAALPLHIPENPPEQSDDATNLIAFQDCTLHEERIIPDAIEAHGEWGDHMAENGSDVFMGALIPLAGENPNSDYNYKAVTGFSSAETYGQFVNAYVSGAFQRAGQLFGRVVDCDLPRVYRTNNIRQMAGDDD